jgi:hypothetical protein
VAKRSITSALLTGAVQETPEGLLQSRPCAYAEAMLEKRFVNMLKNPIANVFDKLLAGKAEQVYAIAEKPNKNGKQNTKIELTNEQKSAIKLPFEQQLSIITGGAGTGKTTVISSVVRLAQTLNIKVFQMALSGQAAAVMRNYNEDHNIHCDSRTIHWYVIPFEVAEKAIKEGKVYREPVKFPRDCLIIIDETSMVDLSVMNRLLCHLPATARILMVGDRNQIPPVGAGLVFHLLCDSKHVPIAKLTKPHRSAAETGIPSAADSVSKGTPPKLTTFDLTAPTPVHGVFFLPTRLDKSDPHSLARVIFQVANKLGLNKTQVITTHRKSSKKWGPILQSIHHINDYFQSQLTAHKTPVLNA